MPTADPLLGSDLELLDVIDPFEPITCQHYNHDSLQRGHTTYAPVIAVESLNMPCCGYKPRAQYLCQSWIEANPYLACSMCKQNGIPFEDCFVVLGPV